MVGTEALVIKRVKLEDRDVSIRKTLKVVDPNKSDVTMVYFATKEVKYVDELSTHTYKFLKKITITKIKDKSLLASNILKETKATLKKEGKETSTAWILEKLAEKLPKTYTNTDSITFKVKETKKKEEIIYKKTDDAFIDNQVYLIAETKDLEGKKVKVKIHEKGVKVKVKNKEKGKKEEKEDKEIIVYNLLKDENVILPVLVYAKKEDKTTNIEVSDWIEIDIKKEKGRKEENNKIILSEGKNTIEIGIKKIQFRPKNDKMASKTEDSIKSFEGWAEKLYIREDETADGKKEKEERNKKIKGDFINLVRDKDADDDGKVKNFPKLISGPKKANIGKEIVYTLENYSKTNNEGDKKNIRWSLYVQGDKKPTKKEEKKVLYISAKSKPNLYTYAKMELVDGKNRLTIIFDKALKGKKVQIESFRGTPDLSTAKDYVRTTEILAEKALKIVEKKNVKLWLETECDDCTKKEKEFLNGSFKLKAKPLWTNPINPSKITLYNYSGTYKPKGSSFGKVRLKWNKTKTKLVSKSHTGLDVFAEKGTDVFACLDGTVERIYGSTNDGSYGNVIVIEVDYTEYLTKSKNKYSLKFSGEIEKGPNFNLNGKVYLRYAHIQKSLVKAGEIVKSGDKIGLSGVTGNATGTRAPHLHFEIANLPRPGKGLVNRCNPAFYVNLIGENQADKKNQKRVSGTSHKS